MEYNKACLSCQLLIFGTNYFLPQIANCSINILIYLLNSHMVKTSICYCTVLVSAQLFHARLCCISLQLLVNLNQTGGSHQLWDHSGEHEGE